MLISEEVHLEWDQTIWQILPNIVRQDRGLKMIGGLRHSYFESANEA